MAEPARRAPTPDVEESPERPDNDSGPWLDRWVVLPDGSCDLLELPLTRELFLDPQIGDQMVQGSFHGEALRMLCDLIERSLASEPDVFIASDLKILWGHREYRRPAPDVMVVRGLSDPNRNRQSFDVDVEGVRPCLIIEVVSPNNAELRHTDLVDKVEVYAQERIPEYLILDPARSDRGQQLYWFGYRLGADGRYHWIEPDAEGRVLSETTGLRFGTSPDRQEIQVFDAATGKRLLTAAEIEKELARLRQELALLSR
jgi:Uma2 family endonuclease